MLSELIDVTVDKWTNVLLAMRINFYKALCYKSYIDHLQGLTIGKVTVKSNCLH